MRNNLGWAKLAVAAAVASNVSLLGAWCYQRWAERSSPPPLTDDDSAASPPDIPDAEGDTTEDESTDLAFPRALKIVGAIVAPTTLLTSLLVYFGQIYANQSFEYFGVNFTTLDLTLADYLVRSPDGMIVPLIVVIGLAVVAIMLHQVLQSLPRRGWRAVSRVVAPVAIVGGLVLVIFALVDVFAGPIFGEHGELRGVLFAVGVVVLSYGGHTLYQLIYEHGPGRAVKPSVLLAVGAWVALFLLVSVGLFWAVGSYAGGVGMSRAREIEQKLPMMPAVTVFSEKKLSLKAPGVLETPCSDGSDYKYRYEGLTLILQSGNQYLLLPDRWSHASGTAFLLPRSDELRLEFSPAGQPLHAAC